MKRLLVLLFAWGAVYAQGTSANDVGIYGYPAQSQVVLVSKSGPGFRTLCGASCASASSTCATGSALASITDASVTKPYLITVAPGLYDECIALENTDITINAWGAVFKPSTTVTGNVLRIGPNNDGVTPTRIVVNGGVFHNNYFNSPDAGCFVGTGSAGRPVGQITFNDVTCIGLHDGFQANTSGTDNGIFLNNLTSIAGHDSCAFKGTENVYMNGGRCISWSNYCNAGALTGAVNGSSANATHVTLPSTVSTLSVSSKAGYYEQRSITLSNGAGTCAGAGTATISAYDPNSFIVTVGAGLAGNPDPNCNFSIAAPPNSTNPPCADDWDTGNGVWKSAALHFNGHSGTFRANGTQFISKINNGFGSAANPVTPNNGGSVSFLAATGTLYKFTGCLFDAAVNYETPNDDTPSASTNGVLGSITIGNNSGGILGANSNATFEGCTFRFLNSADTDANIFGVTTQAMTSNPGTGTMTFSNNTFDISSTAGGYAGITRDISMDPNSIATIVFGNNSTSNNSGVLFVEPPPTGTPPVIISSSGSKTAASYGLTIPFGDANAPLYGTDDIYCSKATLPDGSGPLGHASIYLDSAVNESKTAVCVYNYDASILELATAAFSTNSATEISAALIASNSLTPGDHWICLGSDSAITPKGPSPMTVGSGVAIKNTNLSNDWSTGSPCPATLTLGGFSAATQVGMVLLAP